MSVRIPIAWAHDRRRLKSARTYWLATVRPDGRPHVAPVWGVWAHQRFRFGAATSTVKGRNVLANPRAALHLDDSEDVLVVEGVVAVLDDAALRAEVDAALAAKYVTICSGKSYATAMSREARWWTFTPARAVA